MQPRGETITVERGTPLRLVLHEYGVEFPCGGHAGCAGCKVRVTGGAAPADEDEAAVLTAAELADGWRLWRAGAKRIATWFSRSSSGKPSFSPISQRWSSRRAKGSESPSISAPLPSSRNCGVRWAVS